MTSLVEDLQALGDTEDKIADSLRALNIKGIPFTNDKCPIAAYLKSKNWKDIKVQTHYISVVDSTGLNQELSSDDISKLLARHVSSFIFNFDNNDVSKKYQDLLDISSGSKPIVKEINMTNLNLRTVENGYFLDYWVDGKSKQRVFYTWDELCNWLKEQVPAHEKKKSP